MAPGRMIGEKGEIVVKRAVVRLADELGPRRSIRGLDRRDDQLRSFCSDQAVPLGLRPADGAFRLGRSACRGDQFVISEHALAHVFVLDVGPLSTPRCVNRIDPRHG